MWEAYLLAKQANARPSDMYAIHGDFRRFCFDRAVITFGSALEAELDSVEAKTDTARAAKRSRVLARWLDREVKYRNPVATVAKDSAPGEVEQAYSVAGKGSEAAFK